MARAFAAQKERQDGLARVWDEGANPWDLVFTNNVGGPLYERNVRRDFQTFLVKAGIPRMRLHDLRHLCASLLLSQGVHPRVIMEILGHSQISLTMNTYSHVMPGATQAAAEALNGLLTRGRPDQEP